MSLNQHKHAQYEQIAREFKESINRHGFDTDAECPDWLLAAALTATLETLVTFKRGDSLWVSGDPSLLMEDSIAAPSPQGVRP